jgi:hypothetical protein
MTCVVRSGCFCFTYGRLCRPLFALICLPGNAQGSIFGPEKVCPNPKRSGRPLETRPQTMPQNRPKTLSTPPSSPFLRRMARSNLKGMIARGNAARDPLLVLVCFVIKFLVLLYMWVKWAQVAFLHAVSVLTSTSSYLSVNVFPYIWIYRDESLPNVHKLAWCRC